MHRRIEFVEGGYDLMEGHGVLYFQEDWDWERDIMGRAAEWGLLWHRQSERFYKRLEVQQTINT